MRDLGVDVAREPEVGDDGAKALVGLLEEDVGALEVAVHDPGLVGGVERAGELLENDEGLVDGQAAAFTNDVEQQPAAEQLHGEEADDGAIGERVLTELEDAAEVTVRDAARELHLALEAAQRLVREAVGANRLERDALLEGEVLGFPHFAHATRGEVAAQHVAIGDEVIDLQALGPAATGAGAGVFRSGGRGLGELGGHGRRESRLLLGHVSVPAPRALRSLCHVVVTLVGE